MILKLTKRELETLEAARSIMTGALIDSRVKGESKEAASLRDRLRDGEANIRAIMKLAALQP
jgi:hypothetical protein